MTALAFLRGPVDLAIMQFMHEHRFGLARQIASKVGKLGDSAGWLGFSGLLWFCGSRFSRPRVPAHRARYIFSSVALSGLLAIVLKLAFGSARPREVLAAGNYGFHWLAGAHQHQLQAFPSGHTTTVFALAASFGLIWPRCRALGFGIALLVGIARVVTVSHFPSDIVAGASLGSGTALYLYPGAQARIACCPLWARYRSRLAQRAAGAATPDLVASVVQAQESRP
ncbi:MAG: phosphatase PAP2 family protein [Planctomycetota bacterium]